jgi:hypothetical protein
MGFRMQRNPIILRNGPTINGKAEAVYSMMQPQAHWACFILQTDSCSLLLMQLR